MMKRYKIIALLGVTLMGISSFVTCLSESSMLIHLGNIGLIASIVIASLGFKGWQP